MSRRGRVVYANPSLPPFLQRIRENLAYKEGPTLESKHEELAKADEDDLNDRPDEKPTVVLLKKSNVTEEEAKAFVDEMNKESSSNERVLFRKPERKMDTKNKMVHSSNSSQKRQNEVIEEENRSQQKQLKTSNVEKEKQTKNSRLLSFDDEEEEET